ncbi:MAG: glycosyltransferase family 10, partial [Opitutales bacterium]|nr:glycosyltransferase family 10 [Opitutales bacterium]
MRIKLSINLKHPLLLQTPGGLGQWKDATFILNEEVAECDAWIVYEGLFGKETTRCPANQVMLITGEPSDIRIYEPGWLRSFDRVRTVQPDITHPRRTVGHTALPWYLGPGYDQLAKADFPAKTDDISVICSNKAMIGGHRRRLRFVEQLLELSPMPRFGRGFRDLPDKWDGLAPFRYSVAVENSRHDHYWTEKIADCFLAGTVPIYWGAPNIKEYFPEEAMIVIDTLDPAEVARIIKAEATPEAYQRRLPALHEAKRRVL